jgi:uncharacterized protein (DUF58 family)
MLVLALHTAYLVALYTGALDARGQMLLALAAYATYLINATQFLLKLRAARLGAARPTQRCQGASPMNAQVIPIRHRRRLRPTPRCCANAASARCSAASPASSGCTARSRTRSSWWWARAPAPT